MSLLPKSRTARRRLTVVAAIAPVLALAVGLSLFAMRDAVVFFYGPSEAHAKHVPAGRTVLETCKAELRASIVDITRRLDIARPEELADGVVLIIEGGMAAHHIFGSQGPCAAMMATCDALIEAHMGPKVSV